nr:cellulase family glycosylhydrolase [Rhodococcus maanshanensis]
MGHRAPLGLDRVPMETLVHDFKALGLNSVRLPFSNQMIRDTRPVKGLTANPGMNGLTPLEVFDNAVHALTGAGLAVILNNHSTSTRWCCGLDGNEFWNSGQSTDQWVNDWVFLAERYKNDPGVVGADLRNEVRRDSLYDPNWGWGNNTDWEAAAELAGNRILKDANPNLLIMIEGLNWQGIPLDGFPHERPILKPVRVNSVTLVRSHKLVYAAHFYGFIGPNHTGASGMGETHDPRFRDLSREDQFRAMDELAGYVATTPDQHFTAPVWISEFDGSKGDVGKDKAWFENMIDYLIDRDLDFAWWPIVSFRHDDQDDWSLLRYDTDGSRHSVFDSDDWRGPHVRRLLSAGGMTGQTDPVRSWSMLYGPHSDDNASLRAANDWDPGARKLACPDDQRLVGISNKGQRGLCTDATQGDLWTPGTEATMVNREQPTTDWAPGLTKYQCPDGQFMIGYSLHGDNLSAILCAQGLVPVGAPGRTLWDDRGDSRPASGEGGDYASGYSKAQCDADEYAAGIAFRSGGGRPDALYCRSLR